jgi:Tol biopolymer transport system component
VTDLRRRLERLEIPGEHDARERAWELVRAAHAEREPVRWPARRLVPAVALGVAAALAAAALSPPGRAVLEDVREAIGVERAAPALVALPAPGRLLVESDSGPWIVHPDGSKRRLGDWREASWSPYGRFVIAASENEVAALEGDGTVRWKLSRRAVRFPRWGGTATDTRVAYLSGSDLHAVAGDGAGDRVLVRGVGPIAPAWRPTGIHHLAYVGGAGNVVLVDSESGRRLWTREVGRVASLEWSRDGTLLLVRGPRSLRVLDGGDGGVRFDLLGPNAAAVVSAALGPDGRSLAFVQRPGQRSDVWLVPQLRPDGSAARRVFVGEGRLTDLAWSPNGRWLLVAWRDADQWVFVRVRGTRRIAASSDVSAQLESDTFPAVAGWCCP